MAAAPPCTACVSTTSARATLLMKLEELLVLVRLVKRLLMLVVLLRSRQLRRDPWKVFGFESRKEVTVCVGSLSRRRRLWPSFLRRRGAPRRRCDSPMLSWSLQRVREVTGRLAFEQAAICEALVEAEGMGVAAAIDEACARIERYWESFRQG